MKKTFTGILSVFMVVVLLFSLSSCGTKSAVKKTIGEFEKACNDLDVEAVLDTLDPSISGLLKLGAGLIGSLTGMDSEEMFNQISSLLGAHADFVGVASFKSLKIKVNDIASNDATADAKVTLTYAGLSGEEKTTDATISLKNTSDKWVITAVKFK